MKRQSFFISCSRGTVSQYSSAIKKDEREAQGGVAMVVVRADLNNRRVREDLKTVASELQAKG